MQSQKLDIMMCMHISIMNVMLFCLYNGLTPYYNFCLIAFKLHFICTLEHTHCFVLNEKLLHKFIFVI